MPLVLCDVIVELNNVEVTSLAQVEGLFAKLDPAKPLFMQVRRGDMARLVVVRPMPSSR